jgi:hypothetical protein
MNGSNGRRSPQQHPTDFVTDARQDIRNAGLPSSPNRMSCFRVEFHVLYPSPSPKSG